jgi:hypothetical protein
MLNNYCQIVEQTDEEKLKMYMECTKEELANMLIEANKVIGRIKCQPVLFPFLEDWDTKEENEAWKDL